MNGDAMANRMSQRSGTVPPRVLIVDDDELELSLMADRLSTAGFEVARATNGEEALALLEREWFPVVVTDWQMPVMDGIALTEELRRRHADDTYVIMLTMREASMDYERGYMSGVDDYLTKRVPDAELFARIHGAFNTLALRQSLKQARSALESATIADESGAFTFRELTQRLHAEIKRAQRYGRLLSVLTVGIHGPTGKAPAGGLTLDQLCAFADVIRGTVRAHVDWLGRLEATDHAAFAVVLPEAGVSEAPVVKDRLIAALRRHSSAAMSEAPRYTFGLAALERGANNGAAIEAKDLLEVAEHCRRCNGRTGPAQRTAVQRSVTGHVGIACRHGYAVDSQCGFKSQGHSDDPFIAAN